ncbi:MAG: urease accessory protein UreE [Pseudooceanicola nanhaiensis]
MIVFSEILGAADAPGFHEPLHRLGHAHAVDHLRLPRADLSRRRLRTRTEAGREVAIALPRDQQLFDGAVLALSDDGALVVRVEAEHWLRLEARDHATALRLGYFCGNLHWRVRFEDTLLLVAVETEERLYHDRLAPMVEAGAVRVLPDVAKVPA